MRTYVRWQARRATAAAAAVLLLAGCGGSGGSSGENTQAGPATQQGCGDAAGCSELYVAMTDADGDFLSYTVDVVSLDLKRANGATVGALPVTTRVDFAQYVDLTEILTAATVPNGTYVEGTLRLDYTNADITVENNGEPAAARAVDAQGNSLGVIDVRVVLDERRRLVVAPGRPALLVVDFDLAASHTVDLATAPVTVTARPALVAALEPVEDKELRLRGPLVSVDPVAGSYVIDVRPFHHRSARLGRITVHADDSTAFEIDGTEYTGGAGLEALAAAGPGTATVAFGTLTPAERRFEAQIVHAGVSVPGAGIDAVIGNVLSRVQDELTVRGATLVRNDAGDARYVRTDITVQLGAGTKVLKNGVRPRESLGPEAISIGQRIHAFGALREEGDRWVLDAADGRVRMQPTHLLGAVVEAVPGTLALDLDAIDGRRVASFDFTGTGGAPGLDADPQHYEIATGALDVLDLLPGESVRAIGFVTPFGATPPDFSARTLVDPRGLRATLAIGWGAQGTHAPFLSAGPDGLLPDLANANLGARHHVRVGARLIDLLDLPAAPRIVPAAESRMAFVIADESASRTYHDFAEFAAALGLKLDGATALIALTAHGQYERGPNVLTARVVIAKVD